MDRVSREKRSEIMSRIRSSGTSPERALARALTIPWTRGRRQTFSADFAFPYSKVAVFVDGEFWHGKGRTPQYDRWRRKIRGNVERDARNRAELRRRGWVVLEFWAETVLSRTGEAAELVRRIVGARIGMRDEQIELIDPMFGVEWPG